MLAAIDLGITNTDVAIQRNNTLEFMRLSAAQTPVVEQVEKVLRSIGDRADPLVQAAVTGGRYRGLPGQAGDVRLVKVSEVSAIGRGGLQLAQASQALVVSAGSGTAVIAARGTNAAHITGSAVGGGTLQGLGRLLLGTSDPIEIDRLAQQGDANQVDLTLVEALGGQVGRLPPNANAVNFGRLAREAVILPAADLAAGLVRMVGQVIAVVAINAARAEKLDRIVVTGHLVDLPAICKVLDEVGGYYNTSFFVPENPGTATALGALLCLEDEIRAGNQAGSEPPR